MSSDHQPRTLLMAWKTSSGVWSTEKAAVKLAFPAGLAVISGLLASWGSGPTTMVWCWAHAAIGSALRHLRLPATYLSRVPLGKYVASPGVAFPPSGLLPKAGFRAASR